MSAAPLSRREMLQLMGIGVGAAALPPFMSKARAAVDEIVWATYETAGKAEYFKAYTEQTGINAAFSYLTSDDALFAGLQAGSSSNWDVLNPGLNGTGRYIENGLFHTLDLNLIPNAASMYPPFKSSPAIRDKDGNFRAVPYLWGLNPVVYRTDKFDSPPDYHTLFDPKYAGQLAMHDYAMEGIVIAALHLGIPRDQVFSLDDKQLADVKKVLIEQKPLLRTYWQSISDLSNLFATGEVNCAFCWRVPYDQLKATMPIAMAAPKAGIFGWCDCLAIPAGIAEESYATSTPVIRDKLSPEQQATIFIDDLSIMDSFMWPVTPPNYNDWLKVWNEVKAS